MMHLPQLCLTTSLENTAATWLARSRALGLSATPAPARPSLQVRTRNLQPALDLSPYEGLELKLKGDGLRYKLIVRTENAWDGVSRRAGRQGGRRQRVGAAAASL